MNRGQRRATGHHGAVHKSCRIARAVFGRVLHCGDHGDTDRAALREQQP